MTSRSMGQYRSVQRTSRRNRSLKDDDEVIGVLEEACISRNRIMAVDREKVNDVLDVTGLSESAFSFVLESRDW